MIITDWLVATSLTACVVLWWLPAFAVKNALFVFSCCVAIVFGVIGGVDDRWQGFESAVVAVLLLIVLWLRRRETATKERGAMITWFTGLSVLLLALIGLAPILMFPIADLPEPSGSHTVGTRSFALTDNHRLGVFAAHPDEPRRLLVKVWYPAGDVAGLESRPYFTQLESSTIGRRLGDMVLGMPFLFQYIKFSQSLSYKDAPLLADDSEYPVVMYSHGYGGHAGQNTALMQELASHGYIVYSVQHTYDSSDTVLPDGDVISMDPAFLNEMSKWGELSQAERAAYVGETFEARYTGQVQAKADSFAKGKRISTQSVAVWLADRTFVLDSLQRREVPDSVKQVVAASDFSRTGEMGMSFGGSITGVLCMVDRRCAAAVNLDGGGYDSTPLGENIPVPLLMLYSDFRYIKEYAGGDENTPARGFNDFSYERPETTGLRRDIHRVMVRNLKHLGLTDLPLIARNPIGAQMFGPIDGRAAVAIQSEMVRAFFDTYLRGLDVGFPQQQYDKYAQYLSPKDISDVRDWWLEEHPQDITQQVVLETSQGSVEIAVYLQRAPFASARFLAMITAGNYHGGSFSHSADLARGDSYGFVQLHMQPTKADSTHTPDEAHFTPAGSEVAATVSGSGSSSHTDLIPNQRGTVAVGTGWGPGGGDTLLFNIENNAVLDPGSGSVAANLQGHPTVFGRVIVGMRVLEAIQSRPIRSTDSSATLFAHPLRSPVSIERAYVKMPLSPSIDAGGAESAYLGMKSKADEYAVP